MTNYEKYKDKIIDILSKGGKFAVKNDGNIADCNRINCVDCRFVGDSAPTCVFKRRDWLRAEYVKPGVKASTLPVDTNLLCSSKISNNIHRNFAKFEGGKIYVYGCGLNSWTAIDQGTITAAYDEYTLEDGTPVIPE